MPGAKGLNLLLKNDGRTVYLGSKTAIDVNPGVSILLVYLDIS